MSDDEHYEDRIAKLEADRDEADRRIAEQDATALLRDARIAELVAQIEGILSAQEYRAVIERAKGVIMNTMRCSSDAAFAVLVAQSQRENRKVHDIAFDLAKLQERT